MKLIKGDAFNHIKRNFVQVIEGIIRQADKTKRTDEFLKYLDLIEHRCRQERENILNVSKRETEQVCAASS